MSIVGFLALRQANRHRRDEYCRCQFGPAGLLHELTGLCPYTAAFGQQGELAITTSLLKLMMGYWVRLAATGDQNGSAAVPWLPYDAASENIQQLDDDIMTLAGGYRNAQCDFMTSLITRGF